MTDGGVPVSRLAAPHVAGLDDLDQLAEAAAESEGVIHLAYGHGSPAEQAAATDRHAIDALGEALAGSGRPFVVTGGTLVLPAGRTGSERDRPDAEAPAAARGASEPIALALSERSVRASVIRLAPCVHDRARRGFAPALITQPSGRECPHISATAHNAGPPCTDRMPRRCSHPRSSQPPPGQSCTVSARREYACGTSPSSLGSIGLLVRSLGTFTSGVDGYVLSGLLPQLASSLHVSSSTAGQLATLFALVYAGSAAAQVYTCCVPKPGKFGDGLIGRAPKPDEMTEVAGTQA